MSQITKITNIIKDNVLNKKDYIVKDVPIDIVRKICKEKHYLHRVYYMFIYATLYVLLWYTNCRL